MLEETQSWAGRAMHINSIGVSHRLGIETHARNKLAPSLHSLLEPPRRHPRPRPPPPPPPMPAATAPWAPPHQPRGPPQCCPGAGPGWPSPRAPRPGRKRPPADPESGPRPPLLPAAAQPRRSAHRSVCRSANTKEFSHQNCSHHTIITTCCVLSCCAQGSQLAGRSAWPLSTLPQPP